MRPRSAAVYRRRRLTALSALGGVVVLTILLIGSCGSDGKPAAAQRAAKKPLIVNLPRGGRRIFPDYRVVAYYGAPQDPQLGELGIGTPHSATAKLLTQAAPYARPGRPVMPALELIATLVTAAPGDDGKYRYRQSGNLI